MPLSHITGFESLCLLGSSLNSINLLTTHYLTAFRGRDKLKSIIFLQGFHFIIHSLVPFICLSRMYCLGIRRRKIRHSIAIINSILCYFINNLLVTYSFKYSGVVRARIEYLEKWYVVSFLTSVLLAFHLLHLRMHLH